MKPSAAAVNRGAIGEAKPPIVVEVLLLSVPEDTLTYRTVRRTLPEHEEPDAVAWRACRPRRDGPFLLHSTSWRYDRGRVILTYAALPDPRPGSRNRPIPLHVGQRRNANTPSTEQIAAHACRHLAFLAHTDDTVANDLCRHPRLRSLILQHFPDVAGEQPAVPAARSPKGRPRTTRHGLLA
jgi:hypothetical protein